MLKYPLAGETEAAIRLLDAIDAGEDRPRGSDIYDSSRIGVRGRELATRLWPDAPGWKRVANCGPNGATRGAGMPRAAGCQAGKLARLERPFTYYLGWERGWTLTEVGRALVIAHREAKIPTATTKSQCRACGRPIACCELCVVCAIANKPFDSSKYRGDYAP
jgi:hypothetical protein